MESIGVLMPIPMSSYLEQELEKHFNLLKLWTVPHKTQFIKDHSASIRAIIGNASAGANAELITVLPKLEIISSFSVEIDKVDLKTCKIKGIRVTNTPDVLIDDMADLAIGLTLAVTLCEEWVMEEGRLQVDHQGSCFVKYVEKKAERDHGRWRRSLSQRTWKRFPSKGGKSEHARENGATLTSAAGEFTAASSSLNASAIFLNGLLFAIAALSSFFSL